MTKLEWVSPHAVQNNFPKDAVTEGLEISITAYPARSCRNVADGATITLQNGRRLFFGGSAPHDGLDLNGKPCIYNLKSTTCHLP